MDEAATRLDVSAKAVGRLRRNLGKHFAWEVPAKTKGNGHFIKRSNAADLGRKAGEDFRGCERTFGGRVVVSDAPGGIKLFCLQEHQGKKGESSVSELQA